MAIHTYATTDTGLRSLADQLNARGVAGPSGGAWYAATIKAMLENRNYTGTFTWAKRREGKYHSAMAGQIRKRDSADVKLSPGGKPLAVDNPQEAWIVVDDAHEALIDRKLFEQVQEKMTDRKRSNPGIGYRTHTRANGDAYLLSGLVFCAHCGCKMHGGTLRAKGNAYTLAIPEVSNLLEFTREYVVLLGALNDGLKPEHVARGFRPTKAVIDLPAEGALSLLDQLSQIAAKKFEQGELRLSIGGADYLHLAKLGNNVKAMASGRVSPIPELLEQYHDLTNPPDESRRFRNPLFRRGLLVALLNAEPWYRPFSTTLAKYDAELFVRQPRRGENTEDKGMPQFANDAMKRFQNEAMKFTRHLERMRSMPEVERPKLKTPLPVIVNRIVRTYVLERAAAKSGVNPAQFEADDKVDWSKVPAKFNESKQKLAQSLLLEFRSRKDQAFVAHFAATFFSVTQRINEADRLELAEALTSCDDRDQRRDDLKTLTLLSLSANS